ncbi:hypothetical protein L0Y46_04470, partial [bacterium]|nr:hypothetical protein [bacterium]
MGFEISTGKYNSPSELITELPPDSGLELEIAEVVANSKMFKLPNKPEVTNDKLQSTAEALAKQYTVALQHEKTRVKTLQEIENLLQADKKDGDWIRKIEVMFEKAPQEAAPGLMGNLRYLPEGIREAVARLALEKAPQEAAPRLM